MKEQQQTATDHPQQQKTNTNNNNASLLLQNSLQRERNEISRLQRQLLAQQQQQQQKQQQPALIAPTTINNAVAAPASFVGADFTVPAPMPALDCFAVPSTAAMPTTTFNLAEQQRLLRDLQQQQQKLFQQQQQLQPTNVPPNAAPMPPVVCPSVPSPDALLTSNAATGQISSSPSPLLPPSPSASTLMAALLANQREHLALQLQRKQQKQQQQKPPKKSSSSTMMDGNVRATSTTNTTIAPPPSAAAVGPSPPTKSSPAPHFPLQNQQLQQQQQQLLLAMTTAAASSPTGPFVDYAAAAIEAAKQMMFFQTAMPTEKLQQMMESNALGIVGTNVGGALASVANSPCHTPKLNATYNFPMAANAITNSAPQTPLLLAPPKPVTPGTPNNNCGNINLARQYQLLAQQLAALGNSNAIGPTATSTMMTGTVATAAGSSRSTPEVGGGGGGGMAAPVGFRTRRATTIIGEETMERKRPMLTTRPDGIEKNRQERVRGGCRTEPTATAAEEEGAAIVKEKRSRKSEPCPSAIEVTNSVDQQQGMMLPCPKPIKVESIATSCGVAAANANGWHQQQQRQQSGNNNSKEVPMYQITPQQLHLAAMEQYLRNQQQQQQLMDEQEQKHSKRTSGGGTIPMGGMAQQPRMPFINANNSIGSNSSKSTTVTMVSATVKTEPTTTEAPLAATAACSVIRSSSDGTNKCEMRMIKQEPVDDQQQQQNERMMEETKMVKREQKTPPSSTIINGPTFATLPLPHPPSASVSTSSSASGCVVPSRPTNVLQQQQHKQATTVLETVDNGTGGRGLLDDEQEEQQREYVDVVGDGPESRSSMLKMQRKAHIEFYRKLKSLRNRGQHLDCQLCLATVLNSDSSIRSHLHGHCKAALFVCKLCQRGFQDQHLVFEHIAREHPSHSGTQFIEDRRDMAILMELLSECFPRVVCRSRDCLFEAIGRLIAWAECQNVAQLQCRLCTIQVLAQKNALYAHLNSAHPSYRCKKCKFACTDEHAQLEHQRREHPNKEVEQNGAASAKERPYCVTLAFEVLLDTLKGCFPLEQINWHNSQQGMATKAQKAGGAAATTTIGDQQLTNNNKTNDGNDDADDVGKTTTTTVKATKSPKASSRKAAKRNSNGSNATKADAGRSTGQTARKSKSGSGGKKRRRRTRISTSSEEEEVDEEEEELEEGECSWSEHDED